MKIYEGHGPELEQVKRKTIKREPEEGNFKTIMDQTLEDAEKAKGSTGSPWAPPAGGIEILRDTGGIEFSADHLEGKEIVSAIQQTLDLVEFYAGRLGDPSFSAEGLTPLVDHLEERMEFLRDMESSPGLPDQLRPVLSDLTLTIGTEVAKFRRGDYA